MRKSSSSPRARSASSSQLPSLTPAEISRLRADLKLPWDVVDGSRLRGCFEFDSFAEAMLFVNDVAALAEEANHHPNLGVYYRRVVIELTTHSSGGISKKDFALAQKIERHR